MSKLSDRIPDLFKRTGGEAGKLDNILAIRLIIATVIFALALAVKLPAAVRIILLALSFIAAGYDLAISAINSVEGGDFFAASLIILASAILAFFFGFAAEGVALVILYQLGLIVIAYVDERSRKAALELLRDQDEELVTRAQEWLKDSSASELLLAENMKKNAGIVLKFTMILAVVYAIALPFLGDFGVSVAVHRALMILLICTPMSIVVAMPLTALFGLCFSAKQGIVFDNAATMEKTANANVAVFDKAGIFSQDEPQLLSVQSDILDNRTFMNFIAHAVYYSEQPFAQAISSAYHSDYKLEVISNFKEIPGNGVELEIAGNPVILAVGSVFSGRGIRVPQDQPAEGHAYYLSVAGRYVGQVVVSDAVNDEAQDLAARVVESGIRRCVLLTEEGNAESQRIGETLDFHEIYSECDTDKKLQVISDLSNNGQNQLVYVYANGFESHSAAAVDIRVSKKSKFADALVQPDRIANLPDAIRICRRMCEVATENAVFAFIIKAFLIFLSMIGYSKLWFVILVDMIAAVATQLHAIRVTQRSLRPGLNARK